MLFPFDKSQHSGLSLIGTSIRIEGDIYFSGDLRLEGSVRGNVCALHDHAGTLVVGEGARIDGGVAVHHLVVQGTINGRVIGFETIDVQASAIVQGDMQYRSIVVRHGAVIDGKLASRASVDLKQVALLERASGG